MNIKSIKRLPLSEIVYQALREAIISGELKPGEKLIETEIARKMNVSVTPVREAFKRLTADELLRIEPWCGAVVCQFTFEKLIEAYQCREALESYACGLAARNINKEGIERLISLNNEALTTKSEGRFVEISTEIHDVILQYAKNAKLIDMIEQLRTIILRDRYSSAHDMTRQHQICNEHKIVIEALIDKNEEKAAKAMSMHIRNGLDFIMEQSKVKKANA